MKAIFLRTLLMTFSLLVLAAAGCAPKGILVLSSTPPGARIQVDGKDSGVTPATLNLTATGHLISLILEGYQGVSETVVVAARATSSLHVALSPETGGTGQVPTGNLYVKSTPSGAAISVNGTARGITTPSLITGLAPGTVSVGLTLAGHNPGAATAVVASNTTVTVAVALTPVAAGAGSLYVKSTPSGAAISLDGTNTGRNTPALLSGLTPGAHGVALALTGYDPGSANATVAANTTATVSVTLNPTGGSGGTNLIRNGDFETNIPFTAVNPNGWELAVGGAHNNHRDSSTKHGGSYSLCMQRSDSAWDVGQMRQWTDYGAVADNDVLELSGWIKSDNLQNPSGAKCKIWLWETYSDSVESSNRSMPFWGYVCDENVSPLAEPVGGLPYSHDWTYFRLTMSPAFPGANRACVVLSAHWENTATLWFDDLKLVNKSR